jgi:peptidoglycan/LPS O-acetylase OafA/YrhL
MKPSTTSSATAIRSKTDRFEALDGWRGICACLVALLHFHGYSPIYSSALVRNSYLFVDFFFVLSGFVIAYTYSTRLDSGPQVKRFLILRLGRLYPLHLFVLFCLVALETLRLFATGEGFKGEHSPTALLSNLLLLHSLNIHDGLTWNGPSWSISTELWAYVTFALVSAWMGMRNWMLIATAVAAPLALFYLSKSGMDTTFDYGFIRCLFGFSLGVACFRLHAARPASLQSPGNTLMTVLEVCIVAAVIAYVSAAGTSTMSFMAPFVFAVAVLIFAIEGGLVSRLFRWRLLKWLGTLSYSIYLTHYLVLAVVPPVVKRLAGQDLWTAMPLPGGQFVMAFGRNNIEGTLLYALVLAATLALSAFTYRWVETPGRDWTRRWLGRPAHAATRVEAQQS